MKDLSDCDVESSEVQADPCLGSVTTLLQRPWLWVLLALCGPSIVMADSVPMRGCAGCHPGIYASYLRHGMAGSLGPVSEPPVGRVANKSTGWQYELRRSKDQSILSAVAPDGGLRTQRVVGQIGAGVFDISWAAVEVDSITGEDINRLFFAPVETVTGHGLELSPFEHAEIPSAVNMALTRDCLTCHTDSKISDLPGAASLGDTIEPANALGARAFDHLQALGCEACHGEARRHVQIMSGLEDGADLGLTELSSLPAARQRDVCARCHLQGDVRFQMVSGRPDPGKPLVAQFPTLVTEKPTDDFRFVGQLERLSLSSCFQSTPEMTCTTCHDPHVSVKEQGIASFERACVQCHGSESASSQNDRSSVSCSRSPELQVQSVTGLRARGEQGCVDCHVRRSAPFDLPGIATADHWVRPTISKPKDVPFRSLTEPSVGLKLWDDGRLAKPLKTAAGKKWGDGVTAMALVQIGDFEGAAKLFGTFPAPGSSQATKATAPAPLVSVETWPTFHQLRAMALLGTSRPQQAEAAFGDALRLDPNHPGGLTGRARMGLIGGNQAQLMNDTQQLIESFPESEGPWQLRAMLAQRLGRLDFQAAGLEAMVKRWPSDAQAWLQLAQVYRALGADIQAADAVERVRLLQPSLLVPPRNPNSGR